jgi:4-amino-4-deoxy-L-arabinose transferase-like glycosyltransferase
MNPPNKSKMDRYLIAVAAFLICLVVPFAQYYFRRYDDNPYTSLHMIYLTLPSIIFFLVLIPCGLLALAIARISLPFPRPLFLFLACFVATAFFWSIPEVNTVAARYVVQAKNLETYGVVYFLKEWGHGIQAWMDLPAIPFFDGLMFSIFGESRIFIQLFTAVLFGLTSIVTYFIGKELWDEETGFYAGLLLLGIPYLIIQTSLMLLDVHTMFFLTLSIYLYIRALEAGGFARSLVAACAVFVAVFCKYSVWPMLSVLPVISLVYYFRKNDALRGDALKTTLRVFLLSLVLVGIPVLLKFDVVIAQIKLMQEFLRPSLGRWTETPASIYLFQINPVITIAAVASIVLAALKRDLKYLIVVWLPFLVVFFEIKRVRYILPVFPMLTLMAAHGLAALRNRDLRKIIAASVIVTSFATCFFLFLPYLKQWSAVNLKDAGIFLDTLDVDVVEVIAVPQKNYPVNPAIAVPLLDLSTHKKIVYRYVPGASTPDEDFRTSRFRDSWEYRNPPYYEEATGDRDAKRAVAVIFADMQDSIPPETAGIVDSLNHTKSFVASHPLFYNQTFVRIYWK